jgi:hypothetical protein
MKFCRNRLADGPSTRASNDRAFNDQGVAEKAPIAKITWPIFECSYYVNYRRFIRDK